MEIRKVGVVGCGQMGGGIAQVCAQAGYEVLVSEVDEGRLRAGLAAIQASLDRGVEKQKTTPAQRDAALENIRGTTGTGGFADRDIVIEAAIEDLDLKKRIFSDMDGICAEYAILASNTSCLSITEMAGQTRRPDRVLGLHFFNPVPIMKLLEIVRTPGTSDKTMETCRGFGESLGKTIVVAKDSPGFITNRLAAPQILNAIRMVEAGEATVEDIDTAMTLGLNYPLGPLALADFIGLDTVLFIADGIHSRLREGQYEAPELLKKMVAEGRLGRKTGSGFYEYN